MLVWNHMSGRWLVLHWWTDDERGHLVFARNEKSLRHLARAVFKKHPDAEVRGVLHIEMVAPSDKMVRIARERDEIEKVDDFYFEIIANLREVVEVGKQPPPPITICTSYHSSDLSDGRMSSNIEDHYDCTNCLNGFNFGRTMTKRELYLKYNARWEATFNKPKQIARARKADVRPTRVESRASKATDDEKLWCAIANFGHHAGGVELHEVDLSDSESYRPRCLSDSALFFYRLLGKEDLLEAELTAGLKQAQDREREASEQRDIKWQRERKAEESLRVDKVIAFFSEGTCHGSPPSPTANDSKVT